MSETAEMSSQPNETRRSSPHRDELDCEFDTAIVKSLQSFPALSNQLCLRAEGLHQRFSDLPEEWIIDLRTHDPDSFEVLYNLRSMGQDHPERFPTVAEDCPPGSELDEAVDQLDQHLKSIESVVSNVQATLPTSMLDSSLIQKCQTIIDKATNDRKGLQRLRDEECFAKAPIYDELDPDLDRFNADGKYDAESFLLEIRTKYGALLNQLTATTDLHRRLNSLYSVVTQNKEGLGDETVRNWYEWLPELYNFEAKSQDPQASGWHRHPNFDLQSTD